MAIWMNIFMEAVEGRGDELAASYAARNPAIREEPGCINFSFYRNVENPDQFILHEEWEDEAALDAHRRLVQQQWRRHLPPAQGLLPPRVRQHHLARSAHPRSC